VGGFAAGAAAAGGIAAAVNSTRAPAGFDPLEPRHEPGFDHVVTVMYENRSFDNILGYLYGVDEKSGSSDFDGLAQGSYSNPGPQGDSVPAHPYSGSTDEIMRHPQPDPGETYPHVNT